MITLMSHEPPDSLLNPDSLLTMLNLAAMTPAGCFVEVGVYKGGAAWYLSRLAAEQDRKLHLFDTFTGIPDQGPQDHEHRIGDFGDTSFESVVKAVPNAFYYVGVFPDTMPRVWHDVIAFAHIDCDQYSGVKASIERILPIMIPGGIMLFDDYDATSGCTLAVKEAFGSKIRLTEQGKAYFVKV